MEDVYEDPAYGASQITPPDSEYKLPPDKADADDIDSYDKYIGTTFLLDPNQDSVNLGTKAKVISRATDFRGTHVGSTHVNVNPLLDTRQYKVELEDGTTDRYFTNTITENL